MQSVLADKVRTFLDLPVNWNGYGAAPPSKQAVHNCLRWIETQGPFEHAPEPMVGAQGEVGLYWDRKLEGFAIELGFEGNDVYGYLVMHSDGRYQEQEGVAIEGDLPLALRDGLSLLRGHCG